MKKFAAVLTLALAVTLAALAYAQDNGAPPDVSPPANNSDMPNVKLPSGWADAGGADERVNNGVDAEPAPATVPAAPVDSGTTLNHSSGDNSGNATSGDDVNGAGWGTSDSNSNGDSESNATGGGDNEGSDSSATSDTDAGDSDSSATGADNSVGASDSSANGTDESAGASDMSNGSGDSESDASAHSDSGDSGDSNTDSGGSDTSSSDSGDASGWK